MSFYEFHQNNSGGSFEYDSDRGLTTIVIIEANSADKANDKLESIGGYFDGSSDDYWGGDCPTCGDRWYPVSEHDAQPVPSSYGRPLAMSKEQSDLHGYGTPIKWQGPDRWEFFVHYLDGSVVGVNG